MPNLRLNHGGQKPPGPSSLASAGGGSLGVDRRRMITPSTKANTAPARPLNHGSLDSLSDVTDSAASSCEVVVEGGAVDVVLGTVSAVVGALVVATAVVVVGGCVVVGMTPALVRSTSASRSLLTYS